VTRRLLLPVMLVLPNAALAAPQAGAGDPVEVALQRCLDAPAGQSTAGQTTCEDTALRAYDHWMNLAYAALMHRLPAEAASRLRTAQRAWLAFRAAEDRARSALYETRQGTMYVPMQAAAAVEVVRSRTLQLEAALRVMTIDD